MESGTSMSIYPNWWKAERGYFTVNPFRYFSDDSCDWWERQRKEYEEDCQRYSSFFFRNLFNLHPKKTFTQTKRLDRGTVMAKVDMMTLVTAYFPSFRRVGGNVLVRCFMHDDKRPSMSVNAAKKVYYCHVCASGGTAIDLVMHHENLDFIGALQRLDSMF